MTQRNLKSASTLAIGAAVGSGISALAAQEGGADFLLAITAARFRNMGSPSIACMLPTHSANGMSLDFAVNEILPRVDLPVLLGVTCWGDEEPDDALASRVGDLGFAGLVNFPSAMHFPQELRQILDQVGLGPRREVTMLRAAQDAGLQALYYCGSRGQARFAAEAGLNQILFNFGWNVGGSLGHAARTTLEESSMVARDIGRLVKSINPQVQFFLEGGPIISSDDLGYVAQHTLLDGYVGGSTLDRLPFESSVANRIAGYKSAKAVHHKVEAGDQKHLTWAQRHGFVGQSEALRGFLEQFYALAHAHMPCAISLEPGSDEAQIVAALKSRARKSVVVIDPRQAETPGQTVRQLFGFGNDGNVTLGALCHADVGKVILRNPHLLPINAQRRLAFAMETKAISHPTTRGLVPLTARLACLLPHDLSDCPGLDPALLNVLEGWALKFPPLRDRADDVRPLLETLFAATISHRSRMPVLSPAAGQVLRGHSWPGNEQELSQIAGRMVQSFAGHEVSQADARDLIASSKTDARDLPAGNDERRTIADALRRNGFHKGNTAHALGISRKTLYNKLRKYGIET